MSAPSNVFVGVKGKIAGGGCGNTRSVKVPLLILPFHLHHQRL
jgi:hypothetical protein